MADKSFLGSLMDVFNGKRFNSTDTLGAPGTAIYGGYVQENEDDPQLRDKEKYRTYSRILANTSITAAGVRYFLNVVANAKWTFTPSDNDRSGEWAELAEKMLTQDPHTPWHRVVRRAAMYRFYGFSVQEWTAIRNEEGQLTFDDIEPRAQLTIERWGRDERGRITGVVQRDPQTQDDLPIPRGKMVYLVDDSLSDSPQGLGLFRHLVKPARALARYEQLEGFGFETDLRGIPVGRGPFMELAKMVQSGEITAKDRIEAEAPIREFIKNHIKGPKLGMLLDSITYEDDETGKPSTSKQWDIELLKGDVSGQEEVAKAIERLNFEMARVLGVEGLLLGQGSTGSLALSKDKSNNFYLMVNGTLTEIREAFTDDLLKTLWELNGFPEEMMPKLETEEIHSRDVEQITSALRDLGNANLMPDDPAINDVRAMLGITQVDMEQLELDMALVGDRGPATRPSRDPEGARDEDTPNRQDRNGDEE